jgi:pyruvate formate lyase activating enzyme
MLIGGFVPFSLIDYPPHTACVVFTQGCNFRCPYCHNPELLTKGAGNRFLLNPFFDFLTERQGKLDAVVITGGEPTLQEDLPEFIEQITALGFQIKIDTNGTNPALLKTLLDRRLVQAVAMDVKAPPEKYQAATGDECDDERLAAVQKSIRLLLKSKIDYEFRTTVVRDLLTAEDVLAIGALVKGAARFALQHFVSSKTHDPAFANATSFSDKEMEELKKELLGMKIKEVVIR